MDSLLNEGFLSLSLPAIEWLKEEGFLRISPQSPLGFLRNEYSTTPEQRNLAAYELYRFGIVRSESFGSHSGSLLPEFTKIIEVISNPLSRLRILLLKEHEKPSIGQFFLTDSLACSVEFDHESLRLGQAIHLSELADSLKAIIRPDSSDSLPPSVIMIRGSVELINVIWKAVAYKVSGQVSYAEAVEILLKTGLETDEANRALGSLVQTKDLAQTGDRLQLPDDRAAVFSRLWASELLELEYCSMKGWDGSEPLVKPSTSRELVFYGPSGDRLFCTYLPVEKALPGNTLSITAEQRRYMLLAHYTFPAGSMLTQMLEAFLADGRLPTIDTMSPFTSTPSKHTGIENVLSKQSGASLIGGHEPLAQTSKAYCTKCGHKSGSHKFCTNCGSPLS